MDGKGYQYKRNPCDQALAPTACQWRLPSEGLEVGCTTKGQKEGAVNCNFMVGISYNRGVVLCEEYFGPLTGEKMANIVEEHFPNAFANSIDPVGKRVLMDNCPRQNCRATMRAYEKVNARVFTIPARSPDLNPIENFFHLVSKQLDQEAIEKNIS